MSDFVLDRFEERWSRRYVDGAWQLQVTCNGRELPFERIRAPAPAIRRRVWLLRLERVWVDLAFFDQLAILTRDGEGASSQVAVQLADEATWAAHFQALGFHEVNAWSESPTELTGRERRRVIEGVHELIRVWVDGTSLCETAVRVEGATKTTDEKTQMFADRASAIAAAEGRLYTLEQGGFAATGTFMKKGLGDALKTPQGVVALTHFERPASPRAALEAAIDRVRELHRVLPVGHFIVELMGEDVGIVRGKRSWVTASRHAEGLLREELERLEALEHGAFFREMHADRFGRWQRLGEAPTSGSSFDSFVARYGTLTWVVQSGDFYSGNVSGGGSCVLELNSDEYNLNQLASQLDTPVPGLTEALVFHGGWHDGASFLFDRRSCTADGEHGIFAFDENDPRLPPEPLPPSEIVPFGFWLFDRVDRICTTLVPWLISVQRPKCFASGQASRVADAIRRL